jgi:hypothetical protein
MKTQMIIVKILKRLDSRYEGYLSGGKLVSETEANQRIKKIINGKSKR